MKRIALFIFLILSVITCFAQTQIDPTYQVAWNLLTGSGAPSISCTQNGNYTVYPYGAEWGQSYQDTTNNVEYKCTSSGWVKNLPETGGAITTLSVTGNATLPNITGPTAIIGPLTGTSASFSGNVAAGALTGTSASFSGTLAAGAVNASVNGVLNAAVFGAVGNGTTDDQPSIQAAINTAYANGGGTVLLPGCKTYLINEQLNVRSGVHLTGNCTLGISPSAGAAPNLNFPYDAMTWIYIKVGSGSTATPAILYGANVGISHLGFYYPNQAVPTASTPVQYGYTIAPDSGVTNWDNAFFDHLMFLNSYLGLDTSGAGRFSLSYIYGQPLSIGLHVDSIYDVAKADHIHFWTFYTSPGQNLYNWVVTNGTAFSINRVDGLEAEGWFAYGYNYCANFGNQGNGGAWVTIMALECDTTTHPVYISSMNHINLISPVLNSGASSLYPNIEATSSISGGNFSILGGQIQGASSLGILIEANSGTFNIADVTPDYVNDPILYSPLVVSGTAAVSVEGNLGILPWGGSNTVINGIPMLAASNNVSPSNFNMATWSSGLPTNWSAPNGHTLITQNGSGFTATLACSSCGSQTLNTLQYQLSSQNNLPYVISFTYSTTATTDNFRFAVLVENSTGSQIAYSSSQGALQASGNTITVTIPVMLNGLNNVTFLLSEYGTVSGTINVTNIGLYQPLATLAQEGFVQGWMGNPNSVSPDIASGSASFSGTVTAGALTGTSASFSGTVTGGIAATTVTNSGGVYLSSKITTVSALSTPTLLSGSGADSGMLRVRDNTLGGTALFLIDPNGGVQLIGTSQITGLAAAQVTYSGGNWNIALSSGFVPRLLNWTIYN